MYEYQVFANGEWVTVLTRGGSEQPNAVFAPTSRTPWTEDVQLGYAIDLGSSMSLEAIATNRRTRDILEDHDLSLYVFRDDGSTGYPGPADHRDSLFLGLDYFGFSSFPRSNFVIATVAGGERDYRGAARPSSTPSTSSMARAPHATRTAWRARARSRLAKRWSSAPRAASTSARA